MTFQKILSTAVLSLTFCLPAMAGGGVIYKLDKCNSETRVGSKGEILKSVDGDTVHLKTSAGTFSVRMLGMDTPETHFMNKSQGRFAEEAAQALAQMAPAGTKVTIEVSSHFCDQHGRLLAHLFAGRKHLNAEMVKEGLAINYCVAPDFRYCDDLSKLASDAIAKKRGMFSDPKSELPYDFRRRIANAPQRSYVGNIQSKEVLPPGQQDKITPADRVFFYLQSDIASPYHLIN